MEAYSNDTLNIIFSKAVGSEKYQKYCLYLKNVNPKINCINAFGLQVEDLPSIIENADGLVLTGGPDVNPKYYGREEDSSLCDVDNYRDSLEFALLEYAFEKKMPIFAICRGEQVLNVFLKGTLYPDIPTHFPSSIVHKCKDPNSQCLHWVKIDKNSRLYQWLGQDSILVNSFHHQGVERLAKDVIPVAFAEDGLIEAYEWKNPLQEPFFIAVQWHPERMDPEDRTSKTLAETFLEKVKEYKKTKMFQKK